MTVPQICDKETKEVITPSDIKLYHIFMKLNSIFEIIYGLQSAIPALNSGCLL